MDDSKELLRRAAKAAGIEVPSESPWGGLNAMDGVWKDISPGGDGTRHYYWNPLTSDGDAFRLAVKLGLDLMRTETDVEALAGITPHVKIDAHTVSAPFAVEPLGDDPYAATRRAIVRAAAALGGDGHEA